MEQKLITFAVPCYNSAAYMRHCIETLLSAGEQAEIILVDDGSVKDDTPAICDEYAAKYPTIVKAIHQENGGHGEGVNQGIRNATGLYYKVVDSDDWLDTDALKKVLARLTTLVARGTAPDLMICNYVYEHVEDNTQPYRALHQCVPAEPPVQLDACGPLPPGPEHPDALGDVPHRGAARSAAWCCPSTPSMWTTSLSTSPCPMSRACTTWIWTCTATSSAAPTRA